MSDLRNDQINALGREVTDLRAENARLQAAVDSVSADARARCAERDAAIAENTRLTSERDTIAAARYHWEQAAAEWQASTEKLRAENTPLKDALLALVKASYQRATGGARFCRFCNINPMRVRNHRNTDDGAPCPVGEAENLLLLLEKPSGTEPAVTGTTSDKAPICKLAPDECPACHVRGLSLQRLNGACHALECPDPTAWLRTQKPTDSIAHAFKAHPWGKDVCDAKVDDSGRPRTCARPRSEHQEDWSEKPCSCGAVQNCWAKVASHQTIDGVKHRKESCARG